MEYYNCRVRLKGNLNNEVPMVGISAAEAEVLRAAHGHDALVAVTPVKKPANARPAKAERAYLEGRYRKASVRGEENTERAVDAALGHKSNKLPEKIEIVGDSTSDGNDLVAELAAARAEANALKEQLAEADTKALD